MKPVVANILTICFLFFFQFFGYKCGQAQTVGVVLSGGGAAGLAHVGVLKALEEHNVRIDYITGSSIGSLIGGLYACGWSPKKIEKFITSQEFINGANGEHNDDVIYYFKKKQEDAALVDFNIGRNFTLSKAIPTNLVDPLELDYNLLELFAHHNAAANNNFDSLFIPFRCVASNIDQRKTVCFNNGQLHQAIRASMAFPFYLKPIKVDGNLLFDGGLFNNFPSDIMRRDFNPDIIIGSNISDDFTEIQEDDLFTQLRAMIVDRDSNTHKLANGLIIEPKSSIGTFDFQDSQQAIEIGYQAALKQMQNVKLLVTDSVSNINLNNKRAVYHSKVTPLHISKVDIQGLSKNQKRYVSKMLLKTKKGETLSLQDLKPRFFRVMSDDQIKYLFPAINKIPNSTDYSLVLNVKKSKELGVRFGGHFASKSINTGFIGLDYRYLGTIAARISANSYFGKLYSSGDLRARFDLPFKLPTYLEPYATLNRWDYFRSFGTFFEDTKPSYLIERETILGGWLAIPVLNKGKLSYGGNYTLFKHQYYQTLNYVSTDTADVTRFEGFIQELKFESNSLDRKQFAKKGSRMFLSAKYVYGMERFIPGNKSFDESSIGIGISDWFSVKVSYDQYFNLFKSFKLGITMEGVFSDLPTFYNYTATMAFTPMFRPVPEIRTRFNPDFKASVYVAGGVKAVFPIGFGLDVRLESYYFQPYRRWLNKDEIELSTPWFRPSTIHSGLLVYNSPLGPVSIAANFYDSSDQKWSFLLSFGYVIFNRRALH